MRAPKWNSVKGWKQAVGLEHKRGDGCGWQGGQGLEDTELCQLHQGCLGSAISSQKIGGENLSNFIPYLSPGPSSLRTLESHSRHGRA